MLTRTVARIDEKLMRKTPRMEALFAHVIVPTTKYPPVKWEISGKCCNKTDEVQFLAEMTDFYNTGYEQVRREQDRQAQRERDTAVTNRAFAPGPHG